MGAYVVAVLQILDAVDDIGRLERVHGCLMLLLLVWLLLLVVLQLVVVVQLLLLLDLLVLLLMNLLLLVRLDGVHAIEQDVGRDGTGAG